MSKQKIRAKVVYLDVETTGTVPEYHEIWQLSGQFCYVLENSKRGTIKKFNYFIKPEHMDRISDEIYEVCNITEDEFLNDEKFITQQEAFDKFFSFLSEGKHKLNKFDVTDKWLIGGHNSMSFDYQFLREWWELYKRDEKDYFGSYFYWPGLDLKGIMGILVYLGYKMPKKYKLADIAKHWGIEHGDLHDAAEDIALTKTCIDYGFKLIQDYIAGKIRREQA